MAELTAKEIIDRVARLKQEMGNRNERMADYEAMYCMRIWRDPKRPDDVRVTLPTAYDLIEKSRALLITRPPTITVPTTSTAPDEQERAQKIERFLYGFAERTNLTKQFSDSEWNALTLGEGHLKVQWDALAADDEFPLIVLAPDPRTVYGKMNPQQDRYVELTQTWRRSRREIEGEFNFKFKRDVVMDFNKVEVWLDELVEFIEYWREEISVEMVEPKQVKEPIKTIVERTAEMYQQQIAAASGVPEIDSVIEAAKPVRAARKQRVRRIYHTVVVNDRDGDSTEVGTIVKPTSLMEGYACIPFFSYSGISTPMAGKNRSLSLLFPISNGDAGDDAMGVLAALTAIASIDFESAIKEPHAPIVSDDPDNRIDMSPDAINYVQKGSRVARMQPPSANPAVERSLQLLTSASEQVGIPSIYNGQPQSLSGQAISGLATAFQMTLGLRQRPREHVIEDLLKCALGLVLALSDPEYGIRAFGRTATGKYVEETITSEDIGSEFRVVVRLSALQPKDDIGMLSMLSTLQSKGQISMETFLDMAQKILGSLAADSPIDEIERILRDRVLMDPEMSKTLAQQLAAGYADLLAGRAGGVTPNDLSVSAQLAPQPPPQQPMPPPPTQGAPPGQAPFMPQQGPPQGPPQGSPMQPGMAITPEMVAGMGNPAGMANMQQQAQVAPPMSGAH